MLSKLAIAFLLTILKLSIFAQQQTIAISDNYKRYSLTLYSLEKMIVENGDFGKAVFQVERTFQRTETTFEKLDKIFNELALFATEYKNSYQLKNYRQPDSINYTKNLSIFFTAFDSIRYEKSNNRWTTLYSYSSQTNSASNDWTSMLLNKLLETKKGNCHSLSYLYKIIADKIGAKCWLSLAPNHIYIKNFSQQYGWYNTELTSRSFPTDAWIMASGYVSADAIRSRLYMDTLSNQQSIGLCVLDLAKGYEYETKNYYDGFILKCCDLVLQYHVTNPMALLLRAETLKKVYLKQKEENAPTMKQAYNDMESAYITLARLHYREMPKEMYLKWVEQMQQQRNQ